MIYGIILPIDYIVCFNVVKTTNQINIKRFSAILPLVLTQMGDGLTRLGVLRNHQDTKS